MTAIANVELSNTFDFWRERTNEVIVQINTNVANTGYLTGSFVTNTVFQSALSNTNLAIADRLQVANAEARYSNTAQLANTNTAIADRLQVANAEVYLQVANAEARYSNTAQLANTNLAIADRLQIANAAATYATTGKAIAMALVFG